MRHLVLVLALLALTGTAAACGKKADLEPPPGQKSDFPRQYPR